MKFVVQILLFVIGLRLGVSRKSLQQGTYNFAESTMVDRNKRKKHRLKTSQKTLKFREKS